MTTAPAHVSANVERFMGFADRYDAHRPRPPLAIIMLLSQLAQAPRPSRACSPSPRAVSQAIGL